MSGRKDDDAKPMMNLLSGIAMRATAMVLNFGAKKYTAHNWREGIAYSRLLGAAMRHLTAFIDGEDNDAESGLCHLDHLACCVMFLQEFYRTKPELDDRFKQRAPTQPPDPWGEIPPDPWAGATFDPYCLNHFDEALEVGKEAADAAGKWEIHAEFVKPKKPRARKSKSKRKRAA